MAGQQGSTGRPNHNVIWLIGLAIAAVVVVALMLQSRASVRSGAQVYTSSSANTPTGTAVPGAPTSP